MHFKIGRYPIHHGIIGIIRSLGRAGVSVAAITEDPFTPAAVSRYLKRKIIWTPDVFSEPTQVRERLISIGREFDKKEYLPEEFCQDWVVHGYVGEQTQIAFTAKRLRSWPPFAGQTACAQLEDNPGLASHVLSFCEQVGYRGIFDADLRFDHRDQTYSLFDFNPRVGAPVCLFENDVGVDPVRAMHLDLSDRPVPMGRQLNGQRLVVEQLDFAARPAYRRANRKAWLGT